MEGTTTGRRTLEWWERCELESRGCSADDWQDIYISDATELAAIRNVKFCGRVSIGALSAERGHVIENVRLCNCDLGDNVVIRDVACIEFEPESPCGVGTLVNVLDESGGRPVAIYPGISAQIALLMTREPKWAERHLGEFLPEYMESKETRGRIGSDVQIENCGRILNVSVGDEVRIEGACSLRNGTVVNNAGPGRCFSYVGPGVNAENFIIEDGRVDSGAILRNCYVGQGTIVEKGFSAHDSLFFTNCQMENGEACSVFAGPYTVSVHKSTLLIGCQTSFLNAGSGTNQSNHLYKLGPVHWGILERGVKTSSDSYLMFGAKIGAFSLLMGQHKTHPDSSQFPFSYLFGDDRGATVVIPAMMLRSCGLLRDEHKWPVRDHRVKRKLEKHDRIIFDVLNPLTVDKMLSAYDVIAELLSRQADDDRVIRYRGMKFSRASLERARYLYRLGIFKYLHLHTAENGFPEPSEADYAPFEWVDIAGQPMPRLYLERAMKGESVEEIESVMTEAYEHYSELERAWIASKFDAKWRLAPEAIAAYAADFDAMQEEDRKRNLEKLEEMNEMLAL